MSTHRIEPITSVSLSIFALALCAAAPAAARADSCNSEGDTCIYLYQPDRDSVKLVESAGTGDKRNIRYTINGNYQGQFEDTNYVYTFRTPHNSIIDVSVQSCWNGLFGSTCHGWANASILTAPNARTFTRQQIIVDGKCLDVPAFNTANKTHIEIYDCNGGNNQRWTLKDDGTIHSALDDRKCLDLPAFNTANKTGLELYDCNGGKNQIWSYEDDDTIRGLGGKCLDLPAFNTTNKTQIELYDCNGGNNQLFYAVP
jgi:hypothetical protein